jgi:hypothetical protein
VRTDTSVSESEDCTAACGRGRAQREASIGSVRSDAECNRCECGHCDARARGATWLSRSEASVQTRNLCACAHTCVEAHAWEGTHKPCMYPDFSGWQ